MSPEVEKTARQAVIDGWQKVYPGDAPTLEEIQAIQSIGALEGQYGLGWRDHASPVTGLITSMEGSHNWGSIQCTCKPVDGVCCDGCGYWYDSMPTADGQKYFEQCFHKYASPADGAAGIIKFLSNYKGVMAVLSTGDLDEIAWQMRLGHYFLGFNTDPRKSAEAYAVGLDKRAAATADALGEERKAYRKGGAEAHPDGYDASDTPGEEGQDGADGETNWPGIIADALVSAASLGLIVGGAVVARKAWKNRSKKAA